MKSHQQGVSLIEVLVVISILFILLAITLPNYTYMLAYERTQNHLHSIQKQLTLARIYAVNHQRFITTCPLENNVCTEHWQHLPISSFTDNNGNQVLDNGDELLYQLDIIDPRDTLTYPRTAITYRQDGSISVMQSGSFVYCAKNEPNIKKNRLTVSQVGRIRRKDSNQCE